HEAIREPTNLDPRLRDQLGEILQAVRAAAAKRELEVEGLPARDVAYDAVRHAQHDPRVEAPNRAHLLTPTVNPGARADRRGAASGRCGAGLIDQRAQMGKQGGILE